MNKFDIPMECYVDSKELEDPELVGTRDDFVLVHNYLTLEMGTPVARGYDAKALLEDYFHKPAHLR
ncbi:hypothetical protein HDU99_004628, partial [Rhizoclosmatium hyalinum]